MEKKNMNEQSRRVDVQGRLRRFGPVLTAALLLAHGATASAQAGSSDAGRWTFEFTPYLWGSGLKGDTQAGTLPRTSVDMKFSDLFDVLDFGAMGTFEARRDRWGLLVDVMYISLSDDGTATHTGQGPVGATLTANADVKVKQTMLAAAAMYRVADASTPIDVLGGLRYTAIDVDADIDASLFGPGGTGAAGRTSRGGDKDWLDPFVGVRVQHTIADRWRLVGYADVGGFGAGSDLTWQLIAGATYEHSKRVSIKFGYRYMSIDYDKGGVLYDVTMQGPYAGVGIRF
jgi:opacity protein-like surface antigen